MAMTGQDPKDTYLDILWVDNTNLGIPPATTVTVKSGGGNASLLALSQAEIEFLGILSATVASGVVLETGIALEADAVTVESVLDKNDPTVGVFFITGDPEGALTAGIGSLALREDGGAGTTVYIKESGTGNTGWKAFDVIANFTDLDDVPGTYVPSKYLRVNGAGTAIEFVDVAASSFLDLTDVDFSSYVLNKYIAVNGTADGLVLADPPVSTFISAPDTPVDYTNADGTLVRGNAGADGLEFFDGTQGDVLYHNGTAWTALTAGTSGYVLKTQGAAANPVWATLSFIDLNDTDPTTYSGAGGNLVRVNADPDGLEFLGGAEGEILYHTGTAWAALAVGTDGYVLTTHSTGEVPTWEALPVELPSGAEGEILYHTGAAWAALAVGTNGYVLTTHSTGEVPTWEALPVELPAGTQGEVLYHTGAAWAALDVGTAGQVLTTQGGSANPTWEQSGRKAYITSEFNTGDTWRGKPIYAIVVDFGAGPDNNSKSVASGLGANDVYSIVDVQVMANDPDQGWLGASDGDNTASFIYNKLDYKVWCTTTANLSGVNYEVLLKYIKEPPTWSGTDPHVIATISGDTWGGLAQGVHVLTATTHNFDYTGNYTTPGILAFSWKATPDPTGAANDQFWFIATADTVHRESYGALRTGTGTGNVFKINQSFSGTEWVPPYNRGIGPGDNLFAAYTIGALTLTVSRASDFPLKPLEV